MISSNRTYVSFMYKPGKKKKEGRRKTQRSRRDRYRYEETKLQFTSVHCWWLNDVIINVVIRPNVVMAHGSWKGRHIPIYHLPLHAEDSSARILGNDFTFTP